MEFEMQNVGPSQSSVEQTATNSPKPSASDSADHTLPQQPDYNPQEGLWEIKANEQWRRVTEKGSVLSRYISKSSEKLNFAICDNQDGYGWRITCSDDIDPKTDNPSKTETLIEKLRKEPPTNFCRIVFCENICESDLRVVGAKCGLDIGDWARATRWANLPNSVRYDDHGAWTFLEIPTIWKRKGRRAKSDIEDILDELPQEVPLNRGASFFSRTPQKISPSVWKSRRVAVFFSKHYTRSDSQGRNQVSEPPEVSTPQTMIERQDTSWTCLVLLEPTKEDLLFCYRHVDSERSVDRPPANAHCTTGECYYSIEEESLQNTIKYVTTHLLAKHKDCVEFFTQLAKDICWGWEEFLTQVMEISSVNDAYQWIKSLDEADPCWELFAYGSILTETRYLIRALQRLRTATRVGDSNEQDPLKALEISLQTVDADATKAAGFVKATIEMIYNYISIKEAGTATRSSYNMEYLAILAAIFLPLNFLTGLFGMNIRELSRNSPAWWVPVAVSLPGTFIACVFIFLGNSAWKKYRRRRLNQHWTRRYLDV